MKEADIIQQVKQHFPSHIGDDAACFSYSEREHYVISKDLLVENVHFRLRYQTLESLAHKALHVNLSDLAAMGATPCYVLLGLSIPQHLQAISVFLDAFAAACKAANITLIGGDTTRSETDLFISITVIGKATSIKSRATARVDDQICVVGNLGYAHVGLMSLEQDRPGFEPFKQAFLNPQARLDIGLWLAEQQTVHSMMDLSDGLSTDLTRLCEASGLGAHVALEQLPISPAFEQACSALALDPTKTALTGGEDYALLCTVDPTDYPRLAEACLQSFKQPLSRVGSMTQKKDICFTSQGKNKILDLRPFSHFGE